MLETTRSRKALPPLTRTLVGAVAMLLVSSASGITWSGSTFATLKYVSGSVGANTSMTILRVDGLAVSSGPLSPSSVPPVQVTTPPDSAQMNLPAAGPVTSCADRNTEPVGRVSCILTLKATALPLFSTVTVYCSAPLGATSPTGEVWVLVTSKSMYLPPPLRATVVTTWLLLLVSSASGSALNGSTSALLV